MISNKRKLVISAALLVAASFISFWHLLPAPSQEQARLILYTQPGCPHCDNVHKFIEKNSISKKVAFVEKNAAQKNVAAELAQRADACGIPSNEIGVPLLWDANGLRCVIGDQAINEFLGQIAAQTPQP